MMHQKKKEWRGVRAALPFRAGGLICFCDLRGCSLDEMELANTTFLGCWLGAATFRGADLRRAEFISCYAPPSPPSLVDFTRAKLEGTRFVDCYLSYTTSGGPRDELSWPAIAASAANEALSDRNDIRNHAAARLGELDVVAVAPFLATMLLDEEWDVRAVTLESLGKLRHDRFPHYDDAMLKWMFLALGDVHSMVRWAARDLLKRTMPPASVLINSLERISACSACERLAGLRSAIELVRADSEYIDFLDQEKLHELLSDESAEVRSECLHLLGIIDRPSLLPWILERLSDQAADVRVAALNAIKLLSNPPFASTVLSLLSDPIERVRIEALYTLPQTELFSTEGVRIALTDPSPHVRRLAQQLIEGTLGDREPSS